MLDYRRWKRSLNALLLSLPLLPLAACRSNAAILNDEFRATQDLLSTERYDLALPKAEDGLSRAERTGNSAFKWRFRLLKAEILVGQRKKKEALSLLDGYGEPPAGVQWAESRGRSFLLRGAALYLSGRYSDAQDWLARAAEAAKVAGSASLSAEVALRRGAVLAKISHPQEARAVFDEVIAASTQMHNTYLEANAAGNIGRLLQVESRNDDAIPWFERARLLFSGLGATESIARMTENMGYCYFRLGDYDNALSHLEEAQKVFAKTGNREEQQLIIGDIGDIFYEDGDYKAALDAYQRALDIARLIHNDVKIADWLGNLATTSMELDDWNAAERFNQEALDRTHRLEDRRSQPNLLINAARIEARKDLGKAQTLYRAALTGPTQDPSVPLDAHAGLAELYSRQGLRRSAEQEFGRTLEQIDQRASSLLKDEYKISYAASLIRFYGKYVDFLIANRDPERALEIAESSRSRVLGEKADETAPLPRYQVADYKRIASHTHAVLLEYWLGSTADYLWVITPERIDYHELPSKGDLRRLLDSYRAFTMGSRNPLDVAGETGRKLYQALLGPIMADSPKADRFIIVPDGDLHAFNFETLPSRQDHTKFWIEQATVAVAPSLSYLAGHRLTRDPHAKTHPERGLLIGDPVPATSEYPRLKYAGQEMDSIATAMGVPQQLREAAASPASYMESQPDRFDFIHFAAHAVANQVNPLDSAVILSGTPETFRLFARDVLKHRLTAGIVTISACRGAGAKTYAGEGLVGFAWAFLKAGAENVVAGLWDVNDQSTAKLMTAFYTRIAAGSGASDALRESKLDLIHGGGAYAKPLYWAPFELYMGAYR